MSDDEGVEPGTPEFEAAAMEGLMSNRALPWADRVACGQKAINILRSLLADHKAASALLADVQAGTTQEGPTQVKSMAEINDAATAYARLAHGDLVRDAVGEIWQVRGIGEVVSDVTELWLLHFSDEYADIYRADGTSASAPSAAVFPLTVLDVMPRLDVFVVTDAQASAIMSAPRTWSLSAEPGPEVTAVRDRNGNIHTRQAGGAYPNGVRHIDGWVDAEFVRPWERLVTKLGPLTDATGEVEDKS